MFANKVNCEHFSLAEQGTLLPLTDQQHDLLLDGLAQRRPALDEQLQLLTAAKRLAGAALRGEDGGCVESCPEGKP